MSPRAAFAAVVVGAGLAGVLTASSTQDTYTVGVPLSVPVPVVAERHVAKGADPLPTPPPPAPTEAPRPLEPAPPPQVVKPAPVPATPRCDWGREFEAAVSYVDPSWTASWHVKDSGAWGMTAPDTGEVDIAPRTPCVRVRDIVLHEWIHVQQGRVYGSLSAAEAALARFGGVEVVADCGAKQLGATWFSYTSRCTNDQALAGLAMARGVRAPNT